MTAVKGTILLCAGGTGGHLFPAQALAHELAVRGWEIHLATDDRAQRYSADFPASEIYVIPSATLGSKNPLRLAKTAFRLISGYFRSQALLKRLQPSLVIGFGGYPTLPPVAAAQYKGIATLLHDANAVMGRANRFLARQARMVAMGFEGAADDGAIIIGNPVRRAVLEAAKQPYGKLEKGGTFRLLVFGGSQGAQYFGEAVPKAVALLGKELQERLSIVQQARSNDEARVGEAYGQLGISAEIATFFADMPARIADAHLVIARSGASTVSELSVIGRPSILVPYPHALDHDQSMNARAMLLAGGAQLVEQRDLTPQKLAELLDKAMSEPDSLAKMAQAAKESGRPDATMRLADCAEYLAEGGDPAAYTAQHTE